MHKFFTPLSFLVIIIFFVAVGIVLNLQDVLGVNIGSIMNLGGNRITNVGAPTGSGDAATKGFVDSVAGTLQTRVSGTCAAGQGMGAINSNGTVACQSGGAKTDIVAAAGMVDYTTFLWCYYKLSGVCNGPQKHYYTDSDLFGVYDPQGVINSTKNYSDVPNCYWDTLCTNLVQDPSRSLSCKAPYFNTQTTVSILYYDYCNTAYTAKTGCVGLTCTN